MSTILIGDLLAYHAAHKPADAIAVQYPDGRRTWHELDRNANERARLFAKRGVGVDDKVIVALPNGVPYHETTFALWKLGAIPVTVSARLPPQEFAAIVDLAQPKLVIGADGLPTNGVPQISASLALSGEDNAPVAATAGSMLKASTSGGSTGRPKIILDYLSCRWEVGGPGADFLRLQPDDVILNPGPLYHNAPFYSSHIGFFIGAPVIGMSRFDPEEALHLIETHRVTWVTLVPTMMHRIWSLPESVRNRYDVSSLRQVWHMAAPCPEWLKRKFMDWLGPEKIWELYAGTEGYGVTTIRGDEWLAKPGSVGRIEPGYEGRIVREDGSDAPAGEVGEIYFRPSVKRSDYIGANTRELPGGWFSYGDLGALDADGYLFIADRRTDMILRGGENVFPAEVEAAVSSHCQVASCLVVALPDRDLGARIHAIIEPIAGEVIDFRQLYSFLQGCLSKYKLPESFELSASPLRDDAGKARRSAIRDERAAWLREGRAFQSWTPKSA